METKLQKLWRLLNIEHPELGQMVISEPELLQEIISNAISADRYALNREAFKMAGSVLIEGNDVLSVDAMERLGHVMVETANEDEKQEAESRLITLTPLSGWRM